MNTNLDSGKRKQNQYAEIQYTRQHFFGAKKQKSSPIKLNYLMNHGHKFMI